MRVTLLHNAGAGDDDQPDAQQLIGLVRDAGHAVSYRSTRDDDWTTALNEPADVIAVAGGDGTIGRVAKQMTGRGIPIAVLPMGTANNISHTLGVADLPLEQLIAGWHLARTRRLDIGVALGPWGMYRFIEGLGLGVFAWTIPEADASPTLASLEAADHKITYALQMLKDHLQTCPSVALSATLDGDDLSGEYVLFEAMNTQYIGPNLYLAPHANPGDGQLDVVMVTNSERDRLIDYLSSWQNGEFRRPQLPTRQGRRLAMRWTGFHVHIDDRIWPDEGAMPPAPAPIDVTIEAQAVSFLSPV